MDAEIFYGLVNGETYICEVKEHPYVKVRKVKGEGEESEEEEKKEGESNNDQDKEEEEIINPFLSQADDPSDPANLKTIHKIVVHPKNEQTKDFTDLLDAAGLGVLLNKKLKYL